ncbi:hypothetical protein Droror1_Dr00021638 [Drosera rotundifolia]
MGQKQSQPPPPPSPLTFKLRLGLALLSALSGFIFRQDGTINRRLLSFVDVQVKPHSHDGVTSKDIIVNASRNLWFRLYIPTTTSSPSPRLPVVVYFHGGGFAAASPASRPIDEACRRFAAEVPALVVSASYRLSPENKYPCAYEDGVDVLKFIDRERNDLFSEKGDLGQCFLAGDSAGGNLAHHVVVRAAEHRFEALRIKGLVAMYPFFGGEERTESELRYAKNKLIPLEQTDWLWKAFLPIGSNRDHPAANVFGPKSPELSDIEFPATLLVIAGLDPLQDWQRMYRDWLVKCGKVVEVVEYPNMIHGFAGVPEFKETNMLVTVVCDFVRRQLTE